MDISPAQLYAGYEDADEQLLRNIKSQDAILAEDHYVDGFGVKTMYACVPFVDPQALNAERLTLPIPDDGFHAEAIEYAALADAVNRFAKKKLLGGGRFCAMEIGAGWGPWIGACGVLAVKRGIKDVTLIGVEASSERFKLMQTHLESNQLRPRSDEEDTELNSVKTRLFNGAIWTHDGTIRFPKSAVTDMGAAAAVEDGTDYRGVAADFDEVPCRTLATTVGRLGPVDFLHIDIQGTERELVGSEIDWICSNVRSMMIATHDRAIEGYLFELLFEHGWQLHREKPCRVNWRSKAPTLTGKTVVDGSQYWINERL